MGKWFVILGLLTFVTACAPTDLVVVTDAATAKPIERAKVSPIYPSFAGAAYLTNEKGIAHIDGLFGLPRNGCAVQVDAPGYLTRYIDTTGWRGDNMYVSLESATFALTDPEASIGKVVRLEGRITHLAKEDNVLVVGGEYIYLTGNINLAAGSSTEQFRREGSVVQVLGTVQYFTEPPNRGTDVQNEPSHFYIDNPVVRVLSSPDAP